ncbi:MAG TPA: hypothetical protein VN655_08140 [Pseudolabrys sp.]|nr:hypothetical protein [Pseudolabrys sp.]
MANSTPSGGDHEVVDFRTRRTSAPRPGPRDGAEDDLADYARSADDPAEYRHRMAVNALGLLFVLVLIGAALWLANSIADMRRNQDCVLSGRRGCTPVDYQPIR